MLLTVPTVNTFLQSGRGQTTCCLL